MSKTYDSTMRGFKEFAKAANNKKVNKKAGEKSNIKKVITGFLSLFHKEKKQKGSGVKIRPDVAAFLTCPYPVLENEKETEIPKADKLSYKKI